MGPIALLGGSGLDRWGEPDERRLPETPFGTPSGPVERFSLGARELLFLPRHGPEHDIAPHRINYRANVHALAEAGAEAVVAVNAVGSLDPNLSPGCLALPDQLIDYTWGRATSFRDGASEPLDHVEFAEPFDPEWRARLLRAGDASGVTLRDGGCLGVTQGPRLETAAEIRRLARDGCDLVGMTSLPEAALARERGLPYASVAVVANFAAGIGPAPISMEAIRDTLAGGMTAIRRLIDALLEQT